MQHFFLYASTVGQNDGSKTSEVRKPHVKQGLTFEITYIS